MRTGEEGERCEEGWEKEAISKSYLNRRVTESTPPGQSFV